MKYSTLQTKVSKFQSFTTKFSTTLTRRQEDVLRKGEVRLWLGRDMD